MTKETKSEKKTGLDLLREPFPEHQISKLPKPTKQQTEEVKADYKKGIRCKICGGWHHPDVVHLDYVGHAALTDRLLDCDPNWSWEPVSFDANGSPFLDKNGGLWIRLTVCGVSRLGYGHPDGKSGGDAIKEAIGDAMRNAAMRFGAALDLWHKGELHLSEDDEQKPETKNQKKEEKQEKPKLVIEGDDLTIFEAMQKASSKKVLESIASLHKDKLSKMPEDIRHEFKLAYSRRLAELTDVTMAG